MPPGARVLARALQTSNPAGRLRAEVIRRLTDDGLSRETVLGDLDDLRSELDAEKRIEHEEVVLGAMDQLVGWCNPASSLAKVGFSEYVALVRQGRRAA